MLEEILRLDTEAFIYLNNLGNSSLDSFWTFLSRKEANIVVYLSGLLFFLKNSLKVKNGIIHLLIKKIIQIYIILTSCI